VSLRPVPSAVAQGGCFGTSFSFFDASARSIARSAFAYGLRFSHGLAPYENACLIPINQAHLDLL
jgi:hypothetical protein